MAAADRAAALSPFATERGSSAPRPLVRRRSPRGRRRSPGTLVNRPDDPGRLELRAALRLAGGDPRGAIEDYDRVLARAARWNPPRQGRGPVGPGDYHAAVDQWSLALHRDPEFPEAYLGPGDLFPARPVGPGHGRPRAGGRLGPR